MTRRETALTQEEKRRIQRDTPFTRTLAEEGMVGGRYGVISKTHVTGATSAPQYSALPESSWVNQGASVPPEEPLGYSVEEVPVVGTRSEVERSLAVACDGAAPPADPLIALPNDEVQAPHSGKKLPARALRRPRRRG